MRRNPVPLGRQTRPLDRRKLYFDMRTFLLLITLIIVLTSPVLAQTADSTVVVRFLEKISGHEIVAGQHNAEPNSAPAFSTDSIESITGKVPGLWSGDFLYEPENIQTRRIMIDEAGREWNRGAIVQIMWHACPPTSGEPCSWQGSSGVLSRLSDSQWDSLITDGSALNASWKRELDHIAPYLQSLKDNGVEVLFRPLHEMNQSAFWWGGRPGPNGTAKLYQITHDYLVKTKGLTNLIWEWDLQDFSTLSSDVNSYDPGGSYWDILALDVYGSDGQMYTTSKYNIILNKAGNKPIAIGECSQLPSDATLLQQPRWTFFMAWPGLVFSSNTAAQIKTLYNSPNVITLAEMPGWNITGIQNWIFARPSSMRLSQNFPNPFNPTTMISYRLSVSCNVTLRVYDALGRDVETLVNREEGPGWHEARFNGAGLPSGVYFCRIVAGDYTATRKLALIK